MEKLQQALQRARERRESVDTPSGKTRRPTSELRRSTQREKVEALWDEVPMFEPSGKHMRRSRIFAADATNDSQYFDMLRTKLLLEMRSHGWSRIAITSATPSCGKSTTACNILAGTGRQSETRAMLFDLDLRRPAIAKFFGQKPEAGFADVLEGSVDFKDQARRMHANTMVSFTDKPRRDPAELLLKARTAELLDEIQADYKPDMMLFDMPPVLVSDETRALLKLVDAALIIAASETTTVEQIDQCEREVAEYTAVAGIVLNKCRFMDEGYGYTY